MNPQMQAWLDQEDARTREDVRRYGWAIEYVMESAEEERCSIAYTIGLFGLGHPELVVLGVDTCTAGGLLNNVGARVRGGHDLWVAQLLDFDEWPHCVTVERLPNPGEVLLAANRFYRRPPEASVPAYQLTYDDLNGRFPWEHGYARPSWLQPRPGSYRA